MSVKPIRCGAEMPRILLADEEGVSKGLRTALVHEGCAVDLVFNLDLIETMAINNSYDCIIMELLLPTSVGKMEKDMLLAYLKIASLVKRPPIILRQCLVNADDPWYLAHGAAYVFPRPVTNGEILAAIENLNVLVNQPK